MTAQPVHTKLLNKAAKDTLKPVGLARIGRSRHWIDDRGWWLLNVEFQPSSWTRGTYLNVGVQWLWDAFPAFAFSYGGRVRWETADFVEFESEEQFEPEAYRLAQLAAEEVQRYRTMFGSVRACADVLARGKQVSRFYDAGIAYGLLGEVTRAMELLSRVVRDSQVDNNWDWVKERNRRVEHLCSFLPDVVAFRAAVVTMIRAQRATLRLPYSEIVDELLVEGPHYSSALPQAKTTGRLWHSRK